MKILITGGTGLVGSELGKKLAQQGHELYILTRNKKKANLSCPFPQKPITWEELDNESVVTELDAVINLAGAGVNDQRWTKAYKKQIYDSRVERTQQLVEILNAKAKNLKSFVSTSAVGIYGETGDALVEEDHNKSYSFLGKVCQDWEGAAQAISVAPCAILRVGIVLSEKGGALAEMVPPIQNRVGGALASGQQYMSWIDIDDLVNMFIFAMDNKLSGVFNATAPNPETNRKLSQAIADRLGVGLGPSVPYFALRMVVGEMAPHLIESQKISSSKIQNKGFQFQYKNVKDSITARIPILRGTEKRYIFEQWVPKKVDEVFSFFSDANNLEKLTPKHMNFKVVSISDTPMKAGTEIIHSLRIEGLPVKWKSVIRDWEPPHMFSDTQEKGPYKKWYHVHRFDELAGGTLITDQVDFVLPLGALGYLAAGWKVLKDVKNIFQFRKQTIYDMYSEE